MKKDKRTVYYKRTDDDFAGNNIKTKPVGSSFVYIRKNPLWRLGSFLIYRVIAFPIVFVVCKVVFGLRIKNRKAVRKLRKTGYFIYGNHTQALDAFTPHLVSCPKRSYIVTSPDSVSIPGLKTVVRMLGAIPLPETVSGMKNMVSAINRRCEQGNCIVIFPEAHIWPYYTGVRPFDSRSFSYPAKLRVPVVAMTLTYRRRKGLLSFIKKPAWTLYVSDPFYPDMSLTDRQQRENYRDSVYDFMVKCSSSADNYEYVRYVNVSDSAESCGADDGTDKAITA